ncbi:hypothetical protein SEA_FLORAL_59 [Gordonia phage Floral]|nr:hypothetical protein SEA_POLLUX_61 [Gordonia phage Pollux]QAY17661.1 hypothetical protein SEA_EMSQUAREDA_58 [Gordonia phage EMsquaredA]QDP45141.1 hypothetical protein SEA_MARTEENA_57 [Gordonia phage Marteena]QZD97191.1 hypothetical protein SEA_FLORAL_59 [Gordonia phage Floral]
MRILSAYDETVPPGVPVRYGNGQTLVPIEDLDAARERIAQLEAELRPNSPLRQQASVYHRVLRHPAIRRHLREGAGSWSDQILARIDALAAADCDAAQSAAVVDHTDPEQVRRAAGVIEGLGMDRGVTLPENYWVSPSSLRRTAELLEADGRLVSEP